MSWGAVLAGTAIAVVVGAGLNILGVAVGANLVDAAARDTPDAATFGIGGGVWMVVSHLIGLGLGAYVAARLSGTSDRTDGLLHGLAMWATATILAGMLLGSLASSALHTAGSTLSGVFGGAASGVGSLASAAGGEVADRTSNDALQSTAQSAIDRLQNALAGTGTGDPAQMNSDQRRAEIGQIAARRITEGELPQGDRDRLTALIAAEGGISQEEAQNRVQQVEQQTQQRLQEAEEQARQAADSAATAAAAAAYWTFALLLLGAIVSAIAARLGTRPAPAVTVAARYR
ncbi:hypothetical protein F0Q34_15440 [Pseudoroseomonas oryzae]|uniref:PhnA-like protein n=1 Tax=Teichococcus oryzae TaxID=1608942 RepID=A0A5B2TD52_9PROT|nr:hypothetical protein F0Q34_15440 [Pseudoroseomonas oryzae]